MTLKRTIILTALLVLLAGGLLTGNWLFGDLPDPRSISAHLAAPSIRVTDRNGRLLYEVLSKDGGRHTPLRAEEIPACFRNATVATEDARFFEHPGVDWQGILRAVWINLRGGETLSGGSTITQQVARMLLLTEEERFQTSFRRKLREAFLAVHLTNEFSKEEILSLYLNESNYGSLAYGIEAASHTYFGRPANELSLAECALIAGLPQAPATYNPFTDLQAARERQGVVLHLMVKEGYISEEDAALASRQPIVLTSDSYPFEAPHFVLWVLAQLDSVLIEVPPGESLTVRTTLDLDWQHLAESIIRFQLEKLDNPINGLRHNVKDAALVAIDPETGEILTMVGSPDYGNAEIHGAVNMATAARQPGSALKPFVYALAFTNQNGRPWTPATSILDVPTAFVTHEGDSYVPANYDQSINGPVPVRVALASSLNIPAVVTLQHVGLDNFFNFIKLFGLDDFGDLNQYDLSVALGGGAVRLLDLTAAYGVLANEGQRVTPYAIQEITTMHGEVIYSRPSQTPVKVLDERVAWLISDILNDNEARRLGFGPDSVLRIDRPAAVKTGTTSNFHDNWTVGYTPQVVVGVWAGNADYQPMREVSGVSGAAPIWHAFIRRVLAQQAVEWYERPAGLDRVEVCTRSGMLPGMDCPYRQYEWFVDGTQPTVSDTMYRKVFIDAETGRVATDTTPPERRMERLAMDLPPAAHGWARANGILLLSDLKGTGPMLLAHTAPIQILLPAPNAHYRISPNYPIESQKIMIEAGTNLSLERLTIFLDGKTLAIFDKGPYQIWWKLDAGQHTLSAVGLDENGQEFQSQTIQFSVENSP